MKTTERTLALVAALALVMLATHVAHGWRASSVRGCLGLTKDCVQCYECMP